ncbi:MAG: hypothetical protein SPL96_06270 [Bacteroidales bacterium]|nr:hypothetical protein [Bacteroidales bacterium]
MSTYDDILGKRNLQRIAGQAVSNLKGGNEEMMDQVRGAMAQVRSNGGNSSPTSQMRPGVGDPAMRRVENPTAGYVPAQRPRPEAQEKPVGGYDDIFSRLEKSHQVDEEALKKKETRDSKLAAIADGLGALHTIYSRSRGIEPITSGGPSASSQSRERYARLRGELDKDYSDKLQTYMKMEEMRQAADRQEKLDQYRRDQLASLDRDREEKRKMQQDLTAARVKLYNARMGKAIDESAYAHAYNNAIISGMSETEAINAGLAASKASQDELARQQKAESDAKVAAGQGLANQRNAAAHKNNVQAANVGAPTTTTSTRYDKDGNVSGRTVTTRRKGGGSGKSSGTNRNNQQVKTKTKTRTRI